VIKKIIWTMAAFLIGSVLFGVYIVWFAASHASKGL
jgi:hypothetical protein